MRTSRLRTCAAWCFATFASAACGNAFVGVSEDDASPGGSLDSSMESGAVDADRVEAGGRRDAESRDATSTDAESRDAQRDSSGGTEGGGSGEGGGPPHDAGTDGHKLDASLCLKACPSGFACLAGACVDRATSHFGSVAATDNWSYGSFMNYGTTALVPYKATWTTNGIVFSGEEKNALNLSVFHSITAASYEGMEIPAGTLGLYPGTTTDVDSVVRWTAPETGTYTITATFTGLGTTPPTTAGANVNVGIEISSSKTLDADHLAVSYTNANQPLTLGETVDFYVNFITLSEDEQGGVGLDARITAN